MKPIIAKYIKMNKIRIYTLLISLCISLTGKAQQDIVNITQGIDYNYFQKHLEYLSGDNLQGRDVGSEGYDKAAKYVAEEFEKLGCKPYGDNNTFFQSVPFKERSVIPTSIEFQSVLGNNIVDGMYADNISILTSPKNVQVEEQQQLVFVGFGNIIPDKNINDYEGLDVKDKTVIAMLGAPKSLKDYNSFDPFVKVSNAISQGATGIIIFFNKGLFQNMVFDQIHQFTGRPLVSLADTALDGSMADFNMAIAAFAKKDFINDIFKQNNLNLSSSIRKAKRGQFVSQALKSEINCKYKVKEENYHCKNVVAILPGTDSLLNNEYVTVGAHMDHVGIGKAVKGDSIYNGMWDNATGVAALLSFAETFNKASLQPKRSLVFICYTAEEKGLLGSKYFAAYNNMGIENIVANINIDMVAGLFPTKDIIPMGYSHSNLSEAIDFTAENLNLLVDDNKQEENEYLFRSDQASFLQKGIPVLNVANGYTAVDPKINGYKEIEKWMKKYYHSPFDDLNQGYSKEAFHIGLKYNFLTIYYITNMMEEIKWNEDSWIYKRYVLNSED